MSQPAFAPASGPATARATADRRAEPGAGSRVFYLPSNSAGISYNQG